MKEAALRKIRGNEIAMVFKNHDFFKSCVYHWQSNYGSNYAASEII